MELTLQANKSSVFIKNYENGSFYIDEKIYKHNIVIINNNILEWVLSDPDYLQVDDFEKIIIEKPEIIIIGTGKDSILPTVEVIRQIQIHDIGIEFMKTESACKTFNLLISEERNVAGAFLI